MSTQQQFNKSTSEIYKKISKHVPKKTGKLSDKIIINVSNVHTKKIKNINFKINEGEVLGISGLANSGLRTAVG